MTEVKGKHGPSGYRKGCRCGVCREGHRVDAAKYRPAAGPVEGVEVPGRMEAKTAAEIDDLSLGRMWTPECERLEEQAMSAARIIDLVTRDGRVHLTPPQVRILNAALAELRRVLVPVPAAQASGPVIEPGDLSWDDPRISGDDPEVFDAALFVANLRKFDG